MCARVGENFSGRGNTTSTQGSTSEKKKLSLLLIKFIAIQAIVCFNARDA